MALNVNVSSGMRNKTRFPYALNDFSEYDNVIQLMDNVYKNVTT